MLVSMVSPSTTLVTSTSWHSEQKIEVTVGSYAIVVCCSELDCASNVEATVVAALESMDCWTDSVQADTSRSTLNRRILIRWDMVIDPAQHQNCRNLIHFWLNRQHCWSILGLKWFETTRCFGVKHRCVMTQELSWGTGTTIGVFLGHQLHSPNITAMLGTRRARTTKVSMSTPSITANPSWKISLSGKVVRTANVPARMIPADVITPPVRPIAVATPSLNPSFCVASRILDITKML